MSDISEPYYAQALERAKELLRRLSFRRARADRAVFRPEGKSDADREAVLADLRDFCGARKSHFSSDPYVSARNVGRWEVWLRIQQHLGLDESDVQRLKAVEVDNEY